MFAIGSLSLINCYECFQLCREDPTTPGDLLEGFDICSMHDCVSPTNMCPSQYQISGNQQSGTILSLDTHCCPCRETGLN